MLIDSHVHIGERNMCKKIVETSPYRNYYKAYSCINPDTVLETKNFLKDVDYYYAIPLFFRETTILENNLQLLERIKGDEKAIPILLVSNNEDINSLLNIIQYNILKEHFIMHDLETVEKRNMSYEYLNNQNGFLLLHTLSKCTLSHIKYLRENFPNMNIILAHLGRNATADYEYTTSVIDTISKDDKMFTDISTIFDARLIRYAFDKMGKERILYGSDFPFEVSPGVSEKDYLKYPMNTKLSSEEQEWLYYKSSENILKLTKKF